MENALSQVIEEINSLTQEKTDILDRIARNKEELVGDVSISEKERLTSEIFSGEERIRKIDVLLQGLQQRKASLEKKQQAERIKSIREQLAKLDAELVRGFMKKWSSLQEIISIEEKIDALEYSRSEILAQLAAAGDPERPQIPGLDDVDLRYRTFSIKNQVDGFDINSLINALKKMLEE
jgi:hypothetical protein